MNTSEELLTIRKAAQLLKVADISVRRLAGSGQLKAEEKSGRLYVTRTSVENYRQRRHGD